MVERNCVAAAFALAIRHTLGQLVAELANVRIRIFGGVLFPAGLANLSYAFLRK